MPRPVDPCRLRIAELFQLDGKVLLQAGVGESLTGRGLELVRLDRAAWNIAKVLFKAKDGGYWSIEARAEGCSATAPTADVDDALYDNFVDNLNRWCAAHD